MIFGRRAGGGAREVAVRLPGRRSVGEDLGGSGLRELGLDPDPALELHAARSIDVSTVYRLNGSLGCLVNVMARDGR
jgi:hypothetical protein